MEISALSASLRLLFPFEVKRMVLRHTPFKGGKTQSDLDRGSEIINHGLAAPPAFAPRNSILTIKS